MPNKLRVGIVGRGGIAQQRHIPGFMRLKRDVIVQAVCDRNENLAKQIAAKYHLPKVYSELPDMLSAENMEMIVARLRQKYGGLV